MLQNPWSNGKASIIILPSGERGQAIVQLAKLWAQNALIGPAIWVVPTGTSNPEGVDYDSLVVGRNDSRKVDLFVELGRQELALVRVIALKVIGLDGLADERQTQLARRLVGELEISRPQPWGSKDEMKGTILMTINLVVAASEVEDCIDENLFEFGWNRNIVAAPEDRATPAGFSKPINKSDIDGLNKFALLHAVASTGLFSGHSQGPYDLIESDGSPYVGKVFVQRAYARAITGDAAAARLTAKALNIVAGGDFSKRLSFRQQIKDLDFLSNLEQADYLAKAVAFARKLDDGALALAKAVPGDFGARDKIGAWSQIKEFGLFMGTLVWQAPYWIRTGVLDSLGRSITRTFRESGDSVVVDAHIDVKVDRSDVKMLVGLQEYENLKHEVSNALSSSAERKAAVPRPKLWVDLGDLVFRIADGSTENPQMKQPDGNEPVQVLADVDFISPEPNATWHPPKQAADEVVSFAEYSVVWSNDQELEFVDHQLTERERHIGVQIDALQAKVDEARNLAHKTLGLIGEAESDAALFEQDQAWTIIGTEAEVDWPEADVQVNDPEIGTLEDGAEPETATLEDAPVVGNHARAALARNIAKLRNLNMQIRQWVGAIDELTQKRDRVLSVQRDLHDWVERKRASFSGRLLGAIEEDIKAASNELAEAAGTMTEVKNKLGDYWAKANTVFFKRVSRWLIVCMALFVVFSVGASYLLDNYGIVIFGLTTVGSIFFVAGIFSLVLLTIGLVGLMVGLYKKFSYVRGQISDGIARGRWWLERIAYLKGKRDDLELLRPKVENFLGFMVEGLRRPWVVDEGLLDASTQSAELIGSVPRSFQIAEPVDDGFDDKVLGIALGQIVRNGWRRRAFQQRLDSITQEHSLDQYPANEVFRDESATGVRQLCFDEFETVKYLNQVAQEEIKERRAQVFSQVLREDLRPRVRMIEPDSLYGLVTSNDPFEEGGDDLIDWDDFLGALTGLTSPFAANTFSSNGVRQHHHTQVRPVFFGDKRLVPEKRTVGLEYRKLDNTLDGIAEVTYRVDVSEPLDPQDTALLSKVLYSPAGTSSSVVTSQLEDTADAFI